ncbi:phosphotransferase enzyme family protein [Xylona heveae TC161]|uniref:Altered inheritance of mitochondria protein 9, mitochondrial n=1 Tax=Xylona heveae (strain CBS 132557 / TC161) TaxID=1328760 RepID=A0A165FMU8_XYLHT|nr:phosphotransferase enzyme family protein [Xylona heveae TC161]KZF21169.1 phosphotransferase enzyme family protein [Xylona heveae TC161]
MTDVAFAFLEEKILEEVLFQYTRHRWLFNEKAELSKRYLKFNLQQLIGAAVNVCEGARCCTKITKCSEGLYNKAFILTMDNGAEVFAKLPNPNAGPARFSVASEVATRVMLRDLFNIPVPRILAWSNDAANNPVEAAYILEEKAPGVRLRSVWDQWPRELKLQLITQVVDIENKLSTMTFDQQGCIYFREDLRSLIGKAEDIRINSVAPEALSRFSMGPLTANEFWKGDRREMELDRGPWRDPGDYTRAMGLNEIAWIQSQARPRMNYYRSLREQELPEDGLDLLEKYMKVSPYLVPRSTDEAASSNVLWHPDLHLENLFVDPDTHQITRIVDWQSACVAPLFYQYCIPKIFQCHRPIQKGWVVPGRPENYDSLSEDEQEKIDKELEKEIVRKYYTAQVLKRAPRRWGVLRDVSLSEQNTISAIRKPVLLVNGIWENRDLFFLRDSLISFFTDWEELFPDISCPIDFTEKDIELHFKENENMHGVGKMLSLFREEAGIDVDGMVDPNDYEVAQKNNRKLKDIFIGLAKDDEERELFTRLWPYQEPQT